MKHIQRKNSDPTPSLLFLINAVMHNIRFDTYLKKNFKGFNNKMISYFHNHVKYGKISVENII